MIYIISICKQIYYNISPFMNFFTNGKNTHMLPLLSSILEINFRLTFSNIYISEHECLND